MVDVCRMRNSVLQDELKKLRKELDTEKWRQERYLEQQEKKLTDYAEQFLKEEVSRLTYKHDKETKHMSKLIDQ